MASESRARQILRNARDLIQDEMHWTQGHYYENNDGVKCGPDEAFAYCALGAIDAAAGELDGARYQIQDAVGLLARAVNNKTDWLCIEDQVTDWNDDFERKHSEVIDAFDEAIDG